MVCALVSLKLYRNYLEPKTYGVIVVALQIVSYLPFLDGGFRTTTNRDILANTDRDHKLRLIRFSQTFYSLLTLVLIPVAVVLMTGYAMTSNAAHSAESPLFFLALGLVSAVSVLVWSQVTLLVGFQAQTTYFLLNSFAALVSLSAMWISLHSGLGAWAFPIATASSLVVIYPIAIIILKKHEPTLPLFSIKTDTAFWSEFRKIWRQAIDCFRSQVAIMLLFTLDLVLVGMICGAEDAAIYGVLCRFFSLARSLLQAAGEVAWPIVAEKKGADSSFATFLLRLNAWIFGSTTGALALTLSPFLGFYMGPKWTPAQAVVYLMAARLLITGSSSAASYVLIGMGQFRTVARLIERELIVAVILGALLGWKFGLVGIATAFLISTAFGTFAPMFYACAKAMQASPLNMFTQTWWRSLTGCAISLTLGAILLRFASNAWTTFAIAAIASAFACIFGLAVGMIRFRNKQGVQRMPIKLRDLAAHL